MPRQGKISTVNREEQQNMVTVWLDASVYNRLTRLAEIKRVPRSTIMRWFIDDGLKKHRRELEEQD